MTWTHPGSPVSLGLGLMSYSSKVQWRASSGEVKQLCVGSYRGICSCDRMRTLFIFVLAILAGTVVAARSQTTNLQAPSMSTAVSASASNPAPPPAAPAKKSAAELEKLAEPIALYPDPLIAVILPAAAYPLEIVQAARFVKDTNNIAKLDTQPWDDNVKAVAKFPELIAKMDADLPWTIDLGTAFVNQPKELMDAIQNLRSKAQKAGNLKSTEQQIVTVTNIVVQQTNVTEVVSAPTEIIQIAPANPAVIYVPSYPPSIYYPWYPYYPYAAPLVSFGVGFAAGAFWGAAWNNHCNWGRGCVDIDSNVNVNRDVNRNVDRNRSADRGRAGDRGSNIGDRGGRGGGRQAWQPNQNRMQQSGANRANREARGWSSSQTRAALGNTGARPSTGTVGSRPNTGAGSRPSASAGSRGSAGSGISSPRPTGRSTTGAHPSTSPSTSRGSSYSGRSSSGGNSAFNRSSGGSGARSSSYRGSSSRGGGGGGGGRRGGGGGRR
jgi:hypothetical protein